MVNWSHDALIADLLETIDPELNVRIRETALGSKVLSDHGCPIPDIFVMNFCYKRPNIRIYEVKASTADLNGDVRRDKWESYVPYADKIWFAVGPDVETDRLSNQPVGIMRREQKGWKVERKAPLLPGRKPFDEKTMFSLLFAKQALSYDNKMKVMLQEKKAHLEMDLKTLRYNSTEELMKMAQSIYNRERELSYKETAFQNQCDAGESAIITQVAKKFGVYAHDFETLYERIIEKHLTSCIKSMRKEILEIVGNTSVPEVNHEGNFHQTTLGNSDSTRG